MVVSASACTSYGVVSLPLTVSLQTPFCGPDSKILVFSVVVSWDLSIKKKTWKKPHRFKYLMWHLSSAQSTYNMNNGRPFAARIYNFRDFGDIDLCVGSIIRIAYNDTVFFSHSSHFACVNSSWDRFISRGNLRSGFPGSGDSNYEAVSKLDKAQKIETERNRTGGCIVFVSV